MLAATYAVAPKLTATPSRLTAAPTVASRPETVLPNGVTIYSPSNSLDVAKLVKVVDEFLKI